MQVQNYEGTKLTEIPKEWKVVKLKNICKTSSGGTPSRNNPLFYKGKIPWIKTGELKDNYIFDSEEHITEDAVSNSSAKMFPQNTVLFAMYGATIGKTGILKISATTNQACCAFIPINKNTIDPYYLQQYFILNRKHIIHLSEGAGQPNTSQDFLRMFDFICPPYNEQQKIASILTNVDNLIQKTAQVLVQTQRLKKALMQRLLTKGIGHTKFKKTELGEIPEEWQISPLGDLLELCQYGLSKSLSETGDYPIFRMNNIEDGYMKNNNLKYIDISDKIFRQYKLEKGDILINRTNSIELVGKLGIFLFDGDFTFASYLIRFRTKREILNSHFLNFFLNISGNQQKLKNLATHAIGQSNINATNLKTIRIPIPLIPEQQEIISILLRIDYLIQKLKDKKKTEDDLKKGLMQQLLTGRVRVKV